MLKIYSINGIARSAVVVVIILAAENAHGRNADIFIHVFVNAFDVNRYAQRMAN